MSATKARWHFDLDVPDNEGDPFADVRTVEDRGVPIDLTADDATARLNTELIGLVRKESRLDQHGVNCPIKERDDTSCWACPKFCGDTDDNLGALCRVGRQQERICTQLAIIRFSEDV